MNEQSQRSLKASPVNGGPSSRSGLPNDKLRKIHGSAAKMAGDKDAPKNLRESLLEIKDRLGKSSTPGPAKAIVRDPVDVAKATCRGWGFPWRHLRESESALDLGGKWGEKLTSLKELCGSGFLVAMLGDRWTGKTMMACQLAIHQAVKQSHFLARYVRAAEFFIAIKDSYRNGGPSESSQIDKFAEPGLLIIDELNERSDTRWEDMMLTLLIDRRYGDMKDTLVISNHTVEAFQESVGPSIYRRLVQTGGQIICDWSSFRELERSPA